MLSLMCGLGTESSNIEISSLLSVGFAPEVCRHHQWGSFLLLTFHLLWRLCICWYSESCVKTLLLRKEVGANYVTSKNCMLCNFKVSYSFLLCCQNAHSFCDTMHCFCSLVKTEYTGWLTVDEVSQLKKLLAMLNSQFLVLQE